MQKVIIIPESEWQDFQALLQKNSDEIAYLKKHLTAWVGTEEASRVTGLSRKALDSRRGTWEYGRDWKKEGAKVLYNTPTLEAHHATHRLRKRQRILND